jgi:hypothetical protein
VEYSNETQSTESCSQLIRAVYLVQSPDIVLSQNCDIKRWGRRENRPIVKFDVNMGEGIERRSFYITIWKAAWGGCYSTWILGTNSAFSLEPRKTKEKPWSSWPVAGPPDAYWLLGSSPEFKEVSPNCIPYLCPCCVCLYRLVYENRTMIWSRTEYSN